MAQEKKIEIDGVIKEFEKLISTVGETIKKMREEEKNDGTDSWQETARIKFQIIERYISFLEQELKCIKERFVLFEEREKNIESLKALIGQIAEKKIKKGMRKGLFFNSKIEIDELTGSILNQFRCQLDKDEETKEICYQITKNTINGLLLKENEVNM